MAKSDIQAGRSYVSLYIRRALFTRGLQQASSQLKAFGATTTRMGKIAMAAGAGIVGPLVGAVKQFANVGDALDKMSARTGVSVQALAGIGFAAEQSGLSLDQTANGIQRMNRRIGRIAAGLGSKEQMSALKALGLNLEELSQMSPEEKFLAIADAMSKMPDQAQAAGLAQRAFGTSVDGMLPLLLQGKDGINALRKEADDLGLIPTEGETKKAAQLTDAFNRVKRAVGATVFAVGSVLADSFIAIMGTIKDVVLNVQSFIRENAGLVKTVALVGSIIFGAGGLLVGFGFAATAAGIALGGIATIINGVVFAIGSLFTPLVAIPIALAAAGVAWLLFTDSGKTALAGFTELFAPIRQAIGGVINALQAGDFALAGEIAIAGLKVAFFGGLDAIVNTVGLAINDIISLFTGGGMQTSFGEMTLNLMDIWGKFAEGLVLIFGDIPKKIMDQYQQILTGISTMLLEASTKGGAFGAVASQILGVDMSEEQARAELANIRNLTMAKKRLGELQAEFTEREEKGTFATETVKGTDKITREDLQKQIDQEEVKIGRLSGAKVDVGQDASQTAAADIESRVDQFRDPIIAAMKKHPKTLGEQLADGIQSGFLGKAKRDAEKTIAEKSAKAAEAKAKHDKENAKLNDKKQQAADDFDEETGIGEMKENATKTFGTSNPFQIMSMAYASQIGRTTNDPGKEAARQRREQIKQTRELTKMMATVEQFLKDMGVSIERSERTTNRMANNIEDGVGFTG